MVYHDEKTRYIPIIEWSPDGRSLLVILNRVDGTNQMALVPAAGGRPQVLKTLDGGVPNKMSFSPDGRYIAYDVPQKEGAPERVIFALAVAGGGDIPLVQHPAHDFVLGWAPDGRHFLFGSDRSGTIGAWMVPVEYGKPAGPPELFRPDLGSGHPIRMTPTGSYYYGVPIATSDIYTATLDATLSELTAPAVQTAQRFVGTNKWPEWSPDGKQLAYVSQFRPGQGDTRPLLLMIEPLDGGPRRELTLPFTFFSRLRWSPDGRSILSNARDRTNRGGLFRIEMFFRTCRYAGIWRAS